MAPQPPGQPPEDWKQRQPENEWLRDLLTRLTGRLDKIFARVSRMDGRLDAVEDTANHIEIKLEERVTNLRLLAIVGALAVGAGTVVAWMQAASDRRNEAAQKQAAEEVKAMRQELSVIRSENQALYRHFIEGQSKSKAAAEAVRQKEEAKQ